METVRTLRDQGHAVFFTIDAGPQVKVFCLPEAAEPVSTALQQTAGVVRTMQAGVGGGARLINA